MDRLPAPLNTELEKLMQTEQLLNKLNLPVELRTQEAIVLASLVACELLDDVNDSHGDGQRIIRSNHTGEYTSYHHGGHALEVMQGAVQHARDRGADDALTLACCMTAAAGHDIVLGQPKPGDNEAFSALAVMAQMSEYGFNETAYTRSYQAVLGTQLLNVQPAEEPIRQVAYNIDDIVAESVAVGDLGSICKPIGPLNSLKLFIEFNPKFMEGHSQPLTMLEIMEIIDANDGARNAFANYVANESAFYAAVELPPRSLGVMTKYCSRLQANINLLNATGQQLLVKKLTAPQAFQNMQNYSELAA